MICVVNWPRWTQLESSVSSAGIDFEASQRKAKLAS